MNSVVVDEDMLPKILAGIDEDQTITVHLDRPDSTIIYVGYPLNNSTHRIYRLDTDDEEGHVQTATEFIDWCSDSGLHGNNNTITWTYPCDDIKGD